MLTTWGVPGGPGKLIGSELWWNSDPPTLRDADQEVSPLSECAVHVYIPESRKRKSTMK